MRMPLRVTSQCLAGKLFHRTPIIGACRNQELHACCAVAFTTMSSPRKSRWSPKQKTNDWSYLICDAPSLMCRGQGSGRYSRLQADVRAMQHNSSTYCDEPEDTAEFQAWLAVSALNLKNNSMRYNSIQSFALPALSQPSDAQWGACEFDLDGSPTTRVSHMLDVWTCPKHRLSRDTGSPVFIELPHASLRGFLSCGWAVLCLSIWQVGLLTETLRVWLMSQSPDTACLRRSSI